MRLDRDLTLAGGAEAVVDNVNGLAFSMNALLGDRNTQKPRNAASMRAVREIAERYQSLVFAVAPAALTYRADMSEQELRAWAASFINALS